MVLFSEKNKKNHVDLIENLVQRLKKNEEILALILYGSYVREESYRDIDVAVVIRPGYYKNLKKLQFLTDIVSELPSVFDIHIFQDLPLYIQERVLNEGKILLDNDFSQLFDVYQSTHKDYNLFIPHFKSYLGEKNTDGFRKDTD